MCKNNIYCASVTKERQNYNKKNVLMAIKQRLAHVKANILYKWLLAFTIEYVIAYFLWEGKRFSVLCFLQKSSCMLWQRIHEYLVNWKHFWVDVLWATVLSYLGSNHLERARQGRVRGRDCPSALSKQLKGL